MSMTIRSSKLKPEVEFPYGIHLFSKCGSRSISAVVEIEKQQIKM